MFQVTDVFTECLSLYADRGLRSCGRATIEIRSWDAMRDGAAGHSVVSRCAGIGEREPVASAYEPGNEALSIEQLAGSGDREYQPAEA